MNSQEKISIAIKSYVEFLMDMDWRVDHIYIAHFYQSYNPFKDFEECTEICFYNLMTDKVEFENDFCEGQKYVSNISIVPLYKVGEFMRNNIETTYPCVKNNDYIERIKNEDK